MARAFSFEVGGIYHIYNRGVEKREVFTNKNDYERFVALLYLCNNSNAIDMSRYFRGDKSLSEIMGATRGEQLVDIGSYCLMPNHFHLLLHERKEGGISAFMQKLSTAYSMYFNKRYKRSGALFEGRFKGRAVKNEQYLQHLFGYIHLNPIKLYDPEWKEEGIKDVEGARDFLNTYQYSSYLDFVGDSRNEGAIINQGVFSQYFQLPVSFSWFLDGWLSYEGDEFGNVPIAEKMVSVPSTTLARKELTVVQ